MSLTLNQNWKVEAPADELITIFLSLEKSLIGFLGEYSERVQPNYSIYANNGSVNRDKSSEISTAVDSLGGAPTSLAVNYREPYDPLYSGRNVRLAVTIISGIPQIYLTVEGNNEGITTGQFHTLCNLISIEIERKYPALIAVKEPSSEDVKVSNESKHKSFVTKTKSNQDSFISRIFSHPITSGLIVLIVGTILLKVLGIL